MERFEMSEVMGRSSGEVELREVASVSLESAIEGEFNESEVIEGEGEVLTDILDVSTPICSDATAPRAGHQDSQSLDSQVLPSYLCI